MQKHAPARLGLESEQEKHDADLAKGNTPAPRELAEEEKPARLQLVVGGDVDVVSADAERDGCEDEGNLGRRRNLRRYRDGEVSLEHALRWC
jgi:hypothetical protein